jgi:hypothetical protein
MSGANSHFDAEIVFQISQTVSKIPTIPSVTSSK